MIGDGEEGVRRLVVELFFFVRFVRRTTTTISKNVHGFIVVHCSLTPMREQWIAVFRRGTCLMLNRLTSIRQNSLLCRCVCVGGSGTSSCDLQVPRIDGRHL